MGPSAKYGDVSAYLHCGSHLTGTSVRNHRGHQAEHAVRWHQHVHIPPGYLNARILDGPPADPVLLCKAGLVPGIRSRPGSNLVLPSIALGFMHMASIARHQKLHAWTIRQDYIRTVRAKGLPEKEVITRHALRNALIPTTTVIGLRSEEC